jgi:hypothetical protein
MRVQPLTSIVVAVICSATNPTPSAAANIGNWSRTCMAPNWKYGGVESVWDQNVYSPLQAWAFAERMPEGHWQISYNLAQIEPRFATPDFFKFLFYRECAYAKFMSPDQHLGDCQALADMKADHDLSPQALEEISAAYASRGFSFPTGGACPSVP